MEDADIGQQFLKAAVDLFADGDASQLKVHILIHNAAAGEFGTVESQTFEGIDRLFQVNVRAPFLITQALRRHIPSHDNARIIFNSSVSARLCAPGQSIYSATKAAIESFVRTWNNEFGAEQGITVNAVNPGPVNTEIWDTAPEGWKAKVTEMMPMAEPSDISDVVLFLVSKGSRWVSGSVVSTNRGGITY
jgi:NAD(P)-dependent dehydrogenase (short-subunit alcohol dehydrogenase family)